MMGTVVASIVWGIVGLAAFVYVIVDASAPGWAKALAVMISIGFWQVSVSLRK